MCVRMVCRREGRYPEKNWISFLILRVLCEEPQYGYKLMETLANREYVLPERIESGTIYTILRRMERRGLLESVWETTDSGPARRIYKLTDEGLEFLKAGLETMVKRKPLIEDLVSFYKKRFQQGKSPKNPISEQDAKAKEG